MLVAVGFLALVVAVERWQVVQRDKTIEKRDCTIVDLNDRLAVAENNTELLKKTLEREHNDKIEISKRNEELEAAAKADTSFDWYADISNTDVVKQLRANAIRLQNDRARSD